MKVLISDDSAEMRRWMDFIVRDVACEVSHASNFNDAVALARMNPPDVVLLDLRYPDQNENITVDRTEEVRQAAPSAVIIAISGCADDETMRRAIDAGMHGAMTKGGAITQKRLLDAILSAADHCGAEEVHRTITEFLLQHAVSA